jgi:hypothetical protein
VTQAEWDVVNEKFGGLEIDLEIWIAWTNIPVTFAFPTHRYRGMSIRSASSVVNATFILLRGVILKFGVSNAV